MGGRFDVAIVGGGPGGYAAALYGASAGLKICIIERSKIGGTCLHRGCIPTKQLLETATVLRTVRRASEFGVAGVPDDAPHPDWAGALDRQSSTVGTLYKGLEGLLKKKKVEMIEGTGRLTSDGAVLADLDSGQTESIDASATIIATGSKPKTIPGFEIDGTRVITSDEALALPAIPQSIAIVGAGAIGVEFASLFADLGSQVTMVEALPSALPGADSEIALVLERSLKRRGVVVSTGSRVTGQSPIDGDGTRSAFEYDDSAGEHVSIEVERILVAVGRTPVVDESIKASGVPLDERGYIEVDSDMSTALANTYAVGDVVGTPALAHVAFEEGMVAIRAVLGEDPRPVDYAKVPWCIYSHPEVAFAGMGEAAAIEKFGGERVAVSKHRFGAVGRALIIGETEGMVKVVAERDGAILGVHIVGPLASELLSSGYLATNWEATPSDVAAFTQPHPTLSEAFGEAVQALTGRALHG